MGTEKRSFLGVGADVLGDLDLSRIQDEGARQCLVGLLNLHEEVMAALRASLEEVQRLRDEIARLKGEQGKPKIPANTPEPPPPSSTDYSSERERRTPKEWTKATKLAAAGPDGDQGQRAEPALPDPLQPPLHGLPDHRDQGPPKRAGHVAQRTAEELPAER